MPTLDELKTATNSYSFTLVLDGPNVLDSDILDKLLTSGFDDVLFGERGGVQKGDFERENSGSYADTVLDAISELEVVVPGLTVARVQPEELVGVTDVATRVGRSRESIRLLAEGRRHADQQPFPTPTVRTAGHRRLWHGPGR